MRKPFISKVPNVFYPRFAFFSSSSSPSSSDPRSIYSFPTTNQPFFRDHPSLPQWISPLHPRTGCYVYPKTSTDSLLEEYPLLDSLVGLLLDFKWKGDLRDTISSIDELQDPRTFSPPSMLYDGACLMNYRRRRNIDTILDSIYGQLGVEILFVTLRKIYHDSDSPYFYQEFAQQLFDKWGIGDPIKQNGILMLMIVAEPEEVSPENLHVERRIEIITGNGLKSFFPPDFLLELQLSVWLQPLEEQRYHDALWLIASTLRKEIYNDVYLRYLQRRGTIPIDNYSNVDDRLFFKEFPYTSTAFLDSFTAIPSTPSASLPAATSSSTPSLHSSNADFSSLVEASNENISTVHSQSNNQLQHAQPNAVTSPQSFQPPQPQNNTLKSYPKVMFLGKLVAKTGYGLMGQSPERFTTLPTKSMNRWFLLYGFAWLALLYYTIDPFRSRTKEELQRPAGKAYIEREIYEKHPHICTNCPTKTPMKVIGAVTSNKGKDQAPILLSSGPTQYHVSFKPLNVTLFEETEEDIFEIMMNAMLEKQKQRVYDQDLIVNALYCPSCGDAFLDEKNRTSLD